jgi:hypothetical protein
MPTIFCGRVGPTALKLEEHREAICKPQEPPPAMRTRGFLVVRLGRRLNDRFAHVGWFRDVSKQQLSIRSTA